MAPKLPIKAFDFDVQDIYGANVKLSSFKGSSVILCFFRDTMRPSRNNRILELTRYYEEWLEAGVEIIVVYNDSRSNLKKYFAKRPRPYSVIADPKLRLYDLYGVKKVIGKDVVAKKVSHGWFDTVFKGKWAWLSPVGRIMPAEFLISSDGVIKHSWHGKSECDHIPLEQLESFVMSSRVLKRKRLIGSRPSRMVIN